MGHQAEFSLMTTLCQDLTPMTLCGDRAAYSAERWKVVPTLFSKAQE